MATAFDQPETYTLVKRYMRRPAEQLYHTAVDPAELRNLATDPQHAAIKAELSAELDRWLAELAASPIPIDVRQVRVNPSAQVAGEAGFGRQRGVAQPSSLDGGRGTAAGEGRRRPFDVTLELRGTVGLATPPNPATLGGAAPDTDPAAAGGGT
jgi:hypothetical protein